MSAEHGTAPLNAAAEVYADSSVMRGLIVKKITAAIPSDIFRGEMRPLSSEYAEQIERMIHGCKFATIQLEDVEYRENGTVWGKIRGTSP